MKSPAKKKRETVTVWLRSYRSAAGDEFMAYQMRGNVVIQTAYLREWGFKHFGPIVRVEIPVAAKEKK